MPYKTKRVGSKSCVYKKDTGKKVGCTTGSVKKYLAALHINAHEDAPRKKMKSFKDYVEDLNTADGDQKITDDTTVTAEGLYAGSGGDQDPEPAAIDTNPGDEGPAEPMVDEAKKKTKNKVINKVVKFLSQFMDKEMPSEGEEQVKFIKDLEKIAKELQDVGIEPLDITATIREPHMAQQYLIRGPSAKGNAGKGALQDLKDIEDFEILEDEDVPAGTGSYTPYELDGANPETEMGENFMDGKHPGRKGLAKRSGVNTKASVSTLRSVAKHSSGEKARMTHWLANMKAGKAKHHK